MIKKFYLLPVFALSLAGFALTGCDDQSEQQTAPAETTTESTVPSAGTAMTETAAIEQMGETEATVHVSNPRAFATAQTAANGAVLATLHNTASTPDTLLGASSDVANSVELHQTYMDPQTNTMLMRRTSAIDIAAGQTLELEPTGFHIMLVGLKQPLVEGETFNITLEFRNADDVVVPVMVTAPGATAATADHSNHGTVTSAPETTVPADSYVPPSDAPPSEDNASGSDSSAADDTATETPAPADAPAETDADGTTVTE